jgi:hypothetical protein
MASLAACQMTSSSTKGSISRTIRSSSGGVAGLDRALAGGRLARHLVENAVLRGLSATGLERILNRPGLGEASNAYT